MVAGEYFKHFLFGPILRMFQVDPESSQWFQGPVSGAIRVGDIVAAIKEFAHPGMGL